MSFARQRRRNSAKPKAPPVQTPKQEVPEQTSALPSVNGAKYADELQEMLESAESWPVWSSDDVGGITLNVYPQAGKYGRSLRDIALWVAMRESDREMIANLIEWDGSRDYKVDNLPERISQAFSDLLFGEDPDVKPANEADQDNMDEMIEENDLPSEFRRWANDCSSEGEVWWRVYVNRDESDWPVVEAHSRLDVLPLFRGRRVKAVAFIEDLFEQKIEIEGQIRSQHWRHVEIQAEGLTRNLLFQGSIGALGDVRPLTERDETADLPEEWAHNLPVMLADRIPNKIGRDVRLGISDYQGIRDFLLDLNEARVIMAENARIAGKKRVIGPASAIQQDGTFPAGVDFIPHEMLNEDMDPKEQIVVLDFEFNASQLLAYISDLISTALTRTGLAEQFVQSRGSGEGAATSGTALRTRFIPTVLAAGGKARFFDDQIPKILKAMAMVSNLPTESGGTGQQWANVNDLPSVQRSSVLPEDPGEEVGRHVTAVAGEIESVETAVRELHEDWSDEQIVEELQKIRDDRTTYGIGVKGGVGGQVVGGAVENASGGSA